MLRDPSQHVWSSSRTPAGYRFVWRDETWHVLVWVTESGEVYVGRHVYRHLRSWLSTDQLDSEPDGSAGVRFRMRSPWSEVSDAEFIFLASLYASECNHPRYGKREAYVATDAAHLAGYLLAVYRSGVEVGLTRLAMEALSR
jgi:hypothetical protein